ncbi:hypothetical protein V6Z12_A06G201500 [Gossypium hirsutum]
MEIKNESHNKLVQQITHCFCRKHPLVLVAEQSNEAKLSKLIAMDVGNCFQLYTSFVFIAIITFTSNVQRHPFHFLITLSIPNTQTHNMFFYECNTCYFSLDIKCAKLSSSCKFHKHDIHKHPLTFIESSTVIDVLIRFNCSWCHEPLTDAIYFCSDCLSFIIHKKCLDELPTKIDHLTHRLHPLILNRGDSDGLCNLCQKQHSGPFYGCSLCQFKINVECAWPRSIVEDKSRHQHPFSMLWRQGSFICDACDKDDELYKVIEEEKQCEELYEKSMQSSIIRFIEMNEARKATTIQHFSHQHCLVLADKMEEEIDRKCDECMLSISTLFYYCLECPFFLHKTCAELPRIKQHWFRQGNAILLFKGFLECNFCDQRCSGFFYYIGGWEMCLRCAKVADIMKCEGHQHFLFIDFKYREKCNGCGKRCSNGAFRCGKCRFALDFGCLTLPHSTLHKIDEHKLKLTYDDDKEQIYCDICERQRDPSLWYYSCSICDTSAHPERVLRQFPFVNDGVTFPSYYHNHHHDLKFFRKVEGYLECFHCGKLCQEEILKCEESTCDNIIHCECSD